MKVKMSRFLKPIFVALLLAGSGCSHLFYQPSPQTFYLPEKLNLKYEDLNFKAKDGTPLHGWYFPATLEKGEVPHGTIIQFHGNAENISTHFVSLAWLTEAGYNFFTFDYRGYGKSAGSPSQDGVNEDAVAAIQTILAKNKPPKGQKPDVILYGQSLGGAVLLRALHEIQDPVERSRIKTVVIESSFYSYQAISRGKLAQGWLTYLFQPLAYLLVSDAYSPEDYIAEVSPIPLLVIHGDKDRVVPIEFGEGIYDRARDPKLFWRVENGYHIAAMTGYGGRYRKKLLDYLETLSDRPKNVKARTD